MKLNKFYDSIRKTIPLTSENIRGFDFILTEGYARKVPLNDLAYILATTYHETASRMQPIAEYGKGKGRKYGVKGKYGQVPYGRGYVQLTWDFNYEKADKELGLKGALLKNFELALSPKVAVQILFVGMAEGWFTGKKLRDFIDTIDEPDDEDKKEYEGGRKVINGVDKKTLIATYAVVFEKGLKAALYDVPVVFEPLPPRPEPKPIDIPLGPIAAPKKSVWEIIMSIFEKWSKS